MSAFARVHGSFDSYSRTLLYIRNKVGRTVPWLLNNMQRMVLARQRADIEAGKRPRWVILKYRRGGVSTLEVGKNFHRAACYSGQNVVTLAHKFFSTKILFRMAGLFYDKLPPSMRPSRPTKSRQELNFEGLNSLYYIGTASSDEFGRGDTIQRVHWSEVAHSTIGPGLYTGLTKACSHGTMVLESTGNGPSGLFYDIVKDAAEKSWSEWNLIFLPWFIDPENTLPLEPGVELVPGEPHNEIPAEFCEGEVELIEMAVRDWGLLITPEQLAWRRHEWANTKPRTELFFQEFPETWQGAFVAISGLFFDPAVIRIGAAACVPPIHREDQGRFLAWQEPKDGRTYVAGADTSEGLADGDAQYLSIIDYETGAQVARWHGRESISQFGGTVIPKYCARYNRALVGIERNNHGHAVITHCTSSGYHHLFKHKRVKQGGREPEEVLGWETTGQTREPMLDHLRTAVQEEGWAVVNDPVFWSECYTFVRNDKGKYEASEGNNDDSIVGHGIGLEVRRLHVRPRIWT